jgi:uncharacterized cofD-like protein
MHTDYISPIEQLIDAVIHCRYNTAPVTPALQSMAEEVLSFDCDEKRVVLLGGGTGLSTVVGGNSQLAHWPENPNTGLKQVFPRLNVVVCTTDDGRSTGKLLKQLPMIGIGDIRKLCLSMIVPGRLQKTYRIDRNQRRDLLHLIHAVFNHRFTENTTDAPEISNPLLAAPEALRSACPPQLNAVLMELGSVLSDCRALPRIEPDGHCLGNLLLTAAIFTAPGADCGRPPSIRAIRHGIDRIARAIGAPPGSLHPATAAPGQLVFRYANGVEVHGQSKTSTARRGFPIERVAIEFYNKPSINAEAIRALRAADMIILAPGSLYTSSIPVLLVPAIAGAIRDNRHALKILAANFWVEEGETDITHTDKRRGFRVSELLDAYDRNVSGGHTGLFHCVLSANLDHIPGSILRNYALEGKRPLYLDRDRVEDKNVIPVESGISSVEHLQASGFIHHDPQKFSLAVRTLLYAHSQSPVNPPKQDAHDNNAARQTVVLRGRHLLCDYWSSVNAALEACVFEPETLHLTLLDLIWKNRDIRIEHLTGFKRARVLDGHEWDRSTAWDNVLGYFDPQDSCCTFHSQLLNDSALLNSNMLIVLGESILGRYIDQRSWIQSDDECCWGSRCFEIKLLEPRQRTCLLSPEDLHEYLLLARMIAHPRKQDIYRITLNNDDGFIPPGLLFGLMYAWYLDNTYAPVMENEMAILHLPESTLIPHQVQEYRRKKALVDFFRTKIFKNGTGTPK